MSIEVSITGIDRHSIAGVVSTHDLRLIKFLFTGCLVRNQPENALKICFKKCYTLCITRGLINYNVLLPILKNTFQVKK